jgi:A/G-specific adenine glycosylase
VTDFPVKKLLNWYDLNKRELPWRDAVDPYYIWISEIMLQQTRVDTVIDYYHRFTDAFPTVEHLADAKRQDVLKVWEGLGYYSRARNFHDAAKTVSSEYNGHIPDTFSEISKLKGIGPYTASAILSIAFNKPYAVVDGNVIRVLSRYFGITDDIRSQGTKNEIQKNADDILDRRRPGDFNQALMELGATLCTPSKPDCLSCPFSTSCTAFRTVSTDSIPYKSPAKKTPHHHIGVGIIRDDIDRLLIALRPENAMLGGLWEFPGGKQKKGEKIKNTVSRELQEELGINVEVTEKFMELKHAYSHFRITLHAFWCRMLPGSPQPRPVSSQEIRWVQISELDRYPFPKANKTLTERLIEEAKERNE